MDAKTLFSRAMLCRSLTLWKTNSKSGCLCAGSPTGFGNSKCRIPTATSGFSAHWPS